jgi:hypothetical protein
MTKRIAGRLAVLALLVSTGPDLMAQRGRGGGPAQPAQSPQAGAPIDLAGHWVAIVNEDWRWRMVTPPPKDYSSVPLDAEARKVADAWDVSKDGSCLAYGAAALMRMPTRLRISWESENVLRIETDNGQQTRRLLFDRSAAPPAERSLQGFSLAEWERPGRGGGPRGVGGPPPAGPAGPAAPPPGLGDAPGNGPAGPVSAPGGARAGGAAGDGRGGQTAGQGGHLKVVTTRLSGGWLRRNGVPYSESTTLTEYYDRFPVGDQAWLAVTTIVSDPTYLTQDFVTSSHFRREPDGAKWNPVPCKP